MALTGWLKQSTAATVTIGPFVDSTDGNTAETGLTLSQADIRLSKNDGTFAQKTQSSTATHKENGYYTCSLDTTDTNTLGILSLAVNESGALAVRHNYFVLPANVYDSLIAGSDTLDVAVTSMAAGVVTASAIATGAIDADALATDVQAELFGFQVPDAVPADGTRPTIAEALYMIVQYLFERDVTGTTVTVKKANGSTTLLTLALNDATNPTAVTRAT